MKHSELFSLTLTAALILFAALTYSEARTVSGVASVIDGDTLEIHAQRIRLHGIDAPESSQTCTNQDGSRWRCGQKAAFALADHIGTRPIACTGAKTDRYGRLIAVCHLDAEDLNSWLVLNGWAVAYRRYSHDYVPQEDTAKAARAGIWSSSFTLPEDYRHRQRGR